MYSLGLEHATIRDNIIFGCKYGYDEVRYKAVVKACALARDLEVFDSGDMTGKILPALDSEKLTFHCRNRRERYNTVRRSTSSHQFSKSYLLRGGRKLQDNRQRMCTR